MKASRLLPVFSLGLSLVVPAAATTITIDDFGDLFAAETFYTSGGSAFVLQGLEVGAMRLAPGVTTVRESETQTQFGLAGVLGGERTASLTRTAPIGSSSFSRVGSAESGSFQWSHINGVATTTIASLQYGALNALNANFSTLGSGGYFFLGGWILDQGSVTATVSVTSGIVTQIQTLNLAAADALSPVDYTLPFSSFNLINFSDVDVVKLTFTNTSYSQDSGLRTFEARGIVAVPDAGASSLILVAISFAAMIAFGRTRYFPSRNAGAWAWQS
jgi:hypothetical protein